MTRSLGARDVNHVRQTPRASRSPIQFEFPLAMTCFGLTGLRALEAPAANHLLAQVLDTLLGVLDLNAQLYRLGPEYFAILMHQNTPRINALDVALHANLALARESLGPATPVLCLGTVIAGGGRSSARDSAAHGRDGAGVGVRALAKTLGCRRRSGKLHADAVQTAALADQRAAVERQDVAVGEQTAQD
ncbi:hypothetical protein Thivi_0564 [Thiocystis violascens DSM 198]|uniref:GGDEF domain-containing protein n=1 Tax=Thiocystis violascens (strain ATCC 17096 / DSM 198 / 6111) TaxID=765911 RepID=I3Y6K5_THIV6|nr:hypothetical protein Thivi_0564 [Thiocystis violascens DSM 198]